MNKVFTVTSGDNYIYLVEYEPGSVFAVDPSEASGIIKLLEEKSFKLTDILITHHHWDHVAGVEKLKKRTHCRVIGSDSSRIPGIDEVVEHKDQIRIGNTVVNVLGTPGHTKTSVCYYLEASSENHKKGILWTGDTLFVCGCGRIMESTASDMWQSLLKIRSLPGDTKIYCGHDYTIENYDFALTVEPDHPILLEERKNALIRHQRQLPQVPSTIQCEIKTNPFLRADSESVKKALNLSTADDKDVFAKLRQMKDVF